MLFVKKYHYNNQPNQTEGQSNTETSSLTRRTSDKLFDSDNSKSYKVLVVCLVALSVALMDCISKAQFQFAPTFFQLIPLKLNASQASMMLFIYNLFRTIGRFSAIYLSIKFQAKTLLIFDIFLSIVGIIIFYFSNHSYATLVAANIFLGLGIAPFLATFATFISFYLTYDDRISTIVQLTASVSKVRII
jgi:MFS family permease